MTREGVGGSEGACPRNWADGGLTVYTVGHSNHALEAFLGLLRQHGIEVLADVRSIPHSRRFPQFNRRAIGPSLRAKGIEYFFFGDDLGGRPEAEEYYDEEGYVLYHRLAQSPGFRRGVERLVESIKAYRVALLCAEENPAECHRWLLVGRVLREQGVMVRHIRRDGAVQTEEELREERPRKGREQMDLFEMRGSEEWKSTRSAPRKQARQDSTTSSSEAVEP